VVREKGDKTRLAFFAVATAEVLEAWLEVRPPGPWLFASLGGKRRGERLSERGVSHTLNRRAKRAGTIGATNPHAFRHGFARAYLMAGGDLATLSRIMGHSDVGVTANFYSIFTVDELQRRHDEFSPLAGV
jgi:integrase/recombinase XerD